MNPRIFLPPIDSRWRLVHDFVPDDAFKNNNDNVETLWGEAKYNFSDWEKATGDNTKGDSSGPNGWVARYHAWQASERINRGFDGTLPAGTILQIERYHISRSGENQITVKVLISPSKFLTPKKHKGVMRGAGRLYFSLGQFNLLGEVEEFTDAFS